MKRIVKQSIAVCAAVMSLFTTSCDNSQQESTLTEQTIEHQADSIYACTMHPEVTGETGDKCSKCGMKLQLIASETPENIEVKFATEPLTLEAGKEAKLNTSILKDGKIPIVDTVENIKTSTDPLVQSFVKDAVNYTKD